MPAVSPVEEEEEDKEEEEEEGSVAGTARSRGSTSR